MLYTPAPPVAQMGGDHEDLDGRQGDEASPGGQQTLAMQREGGHVKAWTSRSLICQALN
jgi:hypothetical protein